MLRLMAAVAALFLLLAACSSDPTASQSTARHDKSLAAQRAIRAILDDPEAYGSESEVAKALASYYTPDAEMEDAVYGSIGVRQAWYNTLYQGSIDATFDQYYNWVSEDGSEGGSLWNWHGTNYAGNPFEIAGFSRITYTEDGLLSHEYVVYPYPDEYVHQALEGAGT
jgi:hypothetical protein